MPENELKLEESKKQTSIAHRQEGTRAWIAKALTALFAVMVVVILSYFIFGNPDDSRTSNILALVSAVTGVLGFAMGFYFGQSSEKER